MIFLGAIVITAVGQTQGATLANIEVIQAGVHGDLKQGSGAMGGEKGLKP